MSRETSQASEREREREREYVCVCERERERERSGDRFNRHLSALYAQLDNPDYLIFLFFHSEMCLYYIISHCNLRELNNQKEISFFV